MPEELRMQVPYIKSVSEYLGFNILSIEGYEADDVIGTVGRICSNNEWEGVIVTGETLLKAFDRLEVMESTAHSIINSAAIGNIVHISKEEIDDLKVAFNLAD